MSNPTSKTDLRSRVVAYLSTGSTPRTAEQIQKAVKSKADATEFVTFLRAMVRLGDLTVSQATLSTLVGSKATYEAV